MTDYYDISERWNVRSIEERVELTGIFLSATGQGDYERLASEYPGLFGNSILYQSSEDVRSVCELMRTAEQIFALRHATEEPTFDDMYQCRLSPSFMGWAPADTPTEEIQPDSYVITFTYQPGAAKGYREWLAAASRTVASRFPGYRDFSMRLTSDGTLIYSQGLRAIEEYGKDRDDISAIMEQLLTLHLADVATVCDGATANPMQVAYSGVSALWLGLSERLSGGRPYRCAACGKPAIAYGERRTKRFCCPACRKWANAHPGKMRTSWYIEKR